MPEPSNNNTASGQRRHRQQAVDTTYAHVQPQAREIEQAVLGALMIDKDAYAVVCEMINADSFYEPRNQKVYKAIQELSMKEQPVDVWTVAEQLARQRGDAAKAEEAQASRDRADAFVEANGLYRDGKYAEAQAAYDNILKIAPLHLGANVNLTLALLQQGEDDAALRQALACVSLFPDDAGTWINLQAAGVACGFSVADVFQESWRRFGTGANNRAQLLEKAGLTDVAEFNRIWDAIEVDLREAADKGADAGEGQAIGERCSAALAAQTEART